MDAHKLRPRTGSRTLVNGRPIGSHGEDGDKAKSSSGQVFGPLLNVGSRVAAYTMSLFQYLVFFSVTLSLIATFPVSLGFYAVPNKVVIPGGEEYEVSGTDISTSNIQLSYIDYKGNQNADGSIPIVYSNGIGSKKDAILVNMSSKETFTFVGPTFNSMSFPDGIRSGSKFKCLEAYEEWPKVTLGAGFKGGYKLRAKCDLTYEQFFSELFDRNSTARSVSQMAVKGNELFIVKQGNLTDFFIDQIFEEVRDDRGEVIKYDGKADTLQIVSASLLPYIPPVIAFGGESAFNLLTENKYGQTRYVAQAIDKQHYVHKGGEVWIKFGPEKTKVLFSAADVK